MPDRRIIKMIIPGLLPFRDMALRVIMEACKLVSTLDAALHRAGRDSQHEKRPELSRRFELDDPFTIEFTSAFSEIFNNISIHAYAGIADGNIEFTIHVGRDVLMVEITDMGKSFNMEDVPAPCDLPVGGMGIHIARAMLDELHYQPGPPNRWRLVKYTRAMRE